MGRRQVLTFGPFALDRARRELRLADRRISLTALQLRLLWALASHPERAFRREELVRVASRRGRDPSLASVTLMRLRRRLGRHRPVVETVSGGGYRLAAWVVEAGVAARSRRRTPRAAILEFGPFRVDLGRIEAFVEGRRVALTVAEMAVLALLVLAKGKPVHHLAMEQLTASRRGREGRARVFVYTLRRALGRAANWVVAVRGVGYRLVDPRASSTTSGTDPPTPRASRGRRFFAGSARSRRRRTVRSPRGPGQGPRARRR